VRAAGGEERGGGVCVLRFRSERRNTCVGSGSEGSGSGEVVEVEEEVELEVEAECRVWQVRRRNGGHCEYETC